MTIENSTLINSVIKQIEKDLQSGDITAIEELIRKVPYDNLVAFMPDDTVILTLHYSVIDNLINVYRIKDNSIIKLFEIKNNERFTPLDLIKYELEVNPPNLFSNPTIFKIEKIL